MTTSQIHEPGVLFYVSFALVWEQRKLSELATFSKGQGYSKSDLQEIGTPIILYGRLYTKYETVISEVDTFVQPKENSVYSKGGEVIVPASGETAEDISRASVVENAGILLGGDLNVLQSDPKIFPVFLALTISNGEQKKCRGEHRVNQWYTYTILICRKLKFLTQSWMNKKELAQCLLISTTLSPFISVSLIN